MTPTIDSEKNLSTIALTAEAAQINASEAVSQAIAATAHGPQRVGSGEEKATLEPEAALPIAVSTSAEWPDDSEGTKYNPAYHGKLTDTLARMRSGSGRTDQVTKQFSVTEGGVTLTLSKAMQFGTSSHKLLTRALVELTKYNAPNATPQRLRVTFSVDEYASLRREESLRRRPTSTPEEEEAEDKRLSMAMDNFIRKIKKDLQPLHGTFSSEEKIKGKPRSITNLNILGFSQVKNGLITMEFTPTAAEYLVKQPLTQYGDALFAISDRHRNAYILGLQLIEHYNMRSNQIKGTADRYRVGELLKYLDLPSIEKVRHERRSWEDRIKDSFEKALDALKDGGLLADWSYCKAKATPLSDQEAHSILSYEEWSDLFLHFSLVNAPDHSRAIEDGRRRADTKREPSKKKSTRKKPSETQKKKPTAEA